VPMAPRMLLRKCDLRRASCLDLGTMEGLMPVLMARGGAAKVLAVDAINHCAEKLGAVRHYYDVDFDYQNVGLMYHLDDKLPGRAFDLINCSGLLYHVFSPLMILAGIRSLLKRNGMVIVSTAVILDDGYSMEFNNAGRIQVEPNTFWYHSIKLFDYLLRYLKLAPMDCLFVPHAEIQSDVRYVFDKPSGYLSVLCRAVDNEMPTDDDRWMSTSVRSSWEYEGLTDWKRAARQPVSEISYRSEIDKQFFRSELECVDLWEAVTHGTPVISAETELDAHVLKLSDSS